MDIVFKRGLKVKGVSKASNGKISINVVKLPKTVVGSYSNGNTVRLLFEDEKSDDVNKKLRDLADYIKEVFPFKKYTKDAVKVMDMFGFVCPKVGTSTLSNSAPSNNTIKVITFGTDDDTLNIILHYENHEFWLTDGNGDEICGDYVEVFERLEINTGYCDGVRRREEFMRQHIAKISSR